MIPDLRDLSPGFSPKQFVAAVVGTVLKEWDAVILIDGDDANRLGPLGQGKTRMALWLAHAIANGFGIDFDYDRDLVISDDLPHLQRLFPEFCDDCDVERGIVCAVHDLPIQIIVLDEGHWFLFNEWHAYRDVKVLTPIFMSNRKQRRIWIICTNTIWKVIEFFRESRVMVRIRMRSRSGSGEDLAVAEVFLRAGALSNNPRYDAWGGLRGSDKEALPNAIWPDVPRLPEWDGYSPWDRYMARYEDHVHGNGCVSRLRAG